MPGPVPMRSEQLAEERRPGRGGSATKGEMRPTIVPRPDPLWHPIARMLWDGLVSSGQSDFYQQSDWAFAYSLCEDLSMYKKPTIAKDGTEYHKRSGQMLQTIYSAMERLLVTEGDRRRARIELQKPVPEGPSASVSAIDDYKQRLGVQD